ncbi:hypothetical protein [Treponema maltophilum]|nr:hypothetical protein [Treponema maltophilum]
MGDYEETGAGHCNKGLHFFFSVCARGCRGGLMNLRRLLKSFMHESDMKTAWMNLYLENDSAICKADTIKNAVRNIAVTFRNFLPVRKSTRADTELFGTTNRICHATNCMKTKALKREYDLSPVDIKQPR